MEVDPKDWPILSDLMDEWLDLAEESRAAWLAHIESQYSRLLPALRELLAQPRQDFREKLPPVEEASAEQAPEGTLVPGALAGPYRLERELGRSGMAVAWLAMRADGTQKRPVALKFPLVYFHGQTLAARFKHQWDILAKLEDARIARLYDVGVTAHGLPYLGLEYVEGVSITSYCDCQGLSIAARLRLFLEVLRGVQYAHSNLVVHGDLKPSNILVTNSRQVRLLDFGIARLLEVGQTAESANRPLTPEYASPEQIAGGPITIATDVYSAGGLLYELLTGARPKVLPESDPQPPSQAVGDGAIARAHGGITRKALAAALEGDLDTITLKAIRKEPKERYLTADALSQDIDRYLNGEPVLARPDTARYWAQKFVARNKLAVFAAAAAVLALAAGAGIAMWQAHRADLDAATARAVADFLQHDLLSQAGAMTPAGPGRTVDPDIKIRTALDQAAERVAGKFAAQPAIEAAIRQTVGGTYWELGLYAQAEQQMERALNLRRQVLGAGQGDTLKSMQALAEVYQGEGKYAAAEALLNQLVREARDDSRESVVAAHTLAGIASLGRSDYRGAEVQYQRVLDTERRVLGENDVETQATMNDFAAALAREQKYGQAEELYRSVIDIRRRRLGDEHPNTLASMNGLGVMYSNEGQYQNAETWLKSALEGRTRVIGPAHPDTLSSMNGLGLLYMAEGKYKQAEPLLAEAAKTSARVLGTDNPDAQSCLSNLADLYGREGRLQESAEVFHRLLDARLRLYGQDNGYTANTWSNLGDIQLRLNAYGEAGTMLGRAVDHYKKHKVDTWGRYYTECLLGACLAGQGKPAEGKALMAVAYRSLLDRKDTVPFEYRINLDRAKTLAEAARTK